MPKIEQSPNGAILIDNKPYNVGNIEVIVNATFTAVGMYHVRYQKEIVEELLISEWTDNTDTPFASYQALIDYLDPFFFRKIGGGGSGQGWDGSVSDRNSLPTTIPPNAGDIYLVENPVTVTVIGIPYKTYQSGLYIRDTENGNLSDWRRLNVKVKFTSTEFRIVDPIDTSKQLGFLANLLTSGTPRFLTAQDKSYTVGDHSDIVQNAIDIADRQNKVPSAALDNIASWDASGNTKDSGVPVSAIGLPKEYRHIYFATTNATDTVIAAQGIPVKVEGTTTQGFGTSGLVMSINGRVTNVSGRTLTVEVIAGTSFDKQQAGGADDFIFYIAQTSAVLVGSKSRGEGRNNDSNHAAPYWMGELANNQYFEVYVENPQDPNDLKVSDMYLSVKEYR